MPGMNIARLLTRTGQAAADRPALFRGTRLVSTYGALLGSAARMAGALTARHGLQRGDRVALVMTNCPDYVRCLFACWHAGLVCVPVNAKLHAREIAFILENSGARLILTTSDLAATVSEAVSGLASVLQVIETGSAEYLSWDQESPIAIQAAAPTDPAWLFYTSGTTGRPKGAVLTHRNLLVMSLSYLADVDAVTPTDCIFHPAPMSHGSGLYILPHVLAMAAQVVPESGRFDPPEIAELLRFHRGASFFAAPTMVTRLSNAGVIAEPELQGLKTIIYGGGPMYLEDCKRALRTFGPRLAQIYGQGESPMTITVLPRHLHVMADTPESDRRLASVGYAQSAVEIRVAGPADATLLAGQVGEILVRGDTVMAGYWQNEQASAETLRGGWLHTGDLGSLDEHGFLTLVDRSKDVIISGGTNIYPREVEEVLLQHEGVAEVAVVGRPHADWGEEVVAVVASQPGHTVNRSELDALCQEQIARFKRPKEYIFLDALPKNNYGKILKTELRSIVKAGHSRATSDTSKDVTHS